MSQSDFNHSSLLTTHYFIINKKSKNNEKIYSARNRGENFKPRNVYAGSITSYKE